MKFVGEKIKISYTGLLFLVIIMLISGGSYAQSDGYISHKVKKGETLYGLSGKYGVSVEAIKEANPKIKNGLKYGKTVKIPSKAASPKVTAVSDTHTVSQGETLYSIAGKYGISVEQIKKLNGLADNTIKVGESLKVSGGSSAAPKETEKTEKPNIDTSDPVVEESSDEVEEEIVLNESTGAAESISENAQNYAVKITEIKGVKKVTELGLAEAISESEKTETYLALHKTAPVGTVVQVTNEMNKSSVFVRIIGRIPNIGLNEKVVIKISEKAYRKIGAVNRLHLVKLDYFLPGKK